MEMWFGLFTGTTGYLKTDGTVVEFPAPEWGDITGDLVDQTDLQVELDKTAVIETLLGGASFTMSGLSDLLIKDDVQPSSGRNFLLDTVIKGSSDSTKHVLSASKVYELTDDLESAINSISVGSPVTDPPTNRNDPCTKGQYAYSANGLTKYDCVADDTWFVSTLTDSLSTGTQAPTLLSAALSTATDHEVLTLTYSAAVTQGSGYSDSALDLDASSTGNNLPVTYVSGDTSTEHVYTLGATRVGGSETVNFDFGGGTGALENGDGLDLAAITSAAVTNSSSYTPTGGTCADLGSVNQPVLSSSSTISLGQYSNTGLAHAQYFAPNTDITLCGVSIQMKRPTGTGGTADTSITLKIYSDDGVTPKGNRPQTLLYTSTTTYLQSDLTTSLADYTFDFSSVSLSSGVKYWIYVDPVGYDSADYIQLSINASSPTAQEFHVDWDGSAWTLSQYNAISPIKIWGE